MFNAPRRLKESVKRRILSRISTRHYEGIVDEFAEGHGIRKSSVSRHWKAVSQEELARLMDRPLGDLDLVSIMIDGVGIKDTTVIAALGYASDGKKHLLGLWGGATENSTVVKGLLADLVRRGLDPAKPRLFVLDGSKALAKGVRDTFGDKAVIQRCQVHKLRNVLDHLPAKYHAMARMRIRAAWGMDAYEEAQEALEQTADWLETLSSYAAGSLREGMEETITLHRLGLPAALRTTFRSTNPIENIFSTFRDRSRNVRNWSSSPDMPLRWTAAVLLDAESRFHRCRHFKLLPTLVNALAPGVSVAKQVA
jgi:transposase-like protein